MRRQSRNFRERSPQTLIRKSLSAQVAALFSAGEQGAWYDPSDFSTMFQDAAGTTHVTAVGQPVGRILDKSGRGNHATQSTSTSRPVLSARYNLLTKTEQFNDSAWQKALATISSNSTTAPNGTITADTFIPQTGITFTAVAGAFVNSSSSIVQVITVAAGAFIYRLRVKDAGYDMVQLRVSETPLAGTNQAVTRVLLSNGQVISVGNTGNLTGVSSTCTRTSDGWCDITLNFTSGAAQTLYFGLWAWNSTAITSDGIKGLCLWGADLRPASDGINLPVYQRINTVNDYDTTGFPPYLLFDGIDDALQTANINFTGTDKVTVWAGVRKLSDAATSVLAELSLSVDTYNGSFSITAPSRGGSNSYRFFSIGTMQSFAGTGIFAAAPNTSVLTCIGDISGAVVQLRRNGSVVETNNADQGTGNYGNYPLYIGSRGGTTFPFNGRLYSLIIRGAQSTATQISNTEAYVNSRTGAY